MIGRPRIVFFAALALVAALAAPAAATAQSDQEVLLNRIRDAIEARGGGPFVTPLPDSRSGIVSVDTSRALYFYLERGSIRGQAINDFYDAYDAGDMESAYSAFLGNALMMIRATDYGWNGIGVPMTTDAGSEIQDILFKDVGGSFARAEEITQEDIDEYVELLEIVLAALENGA